MSRNRMTWAEGRLASAAPAIPGYGKEDQDHPAHQPDPDYTKYQKGDPSAWAEDVRKPPYKQGNPPALPGYDVEDKDHPAHIDPPRVPKEAARSMKAAVEKKAKKCCVIARAMLGKKASASMVEDQALDMMDWSDNRIQATLGRLGGGFLAQFEDEFGPMDDFGVDDDFGGPVDLMDDDGDLDMLLAQEAGKRADQNDPAGKTLAPTPKSEEAARKEAKKAEDEDEDEKEDETAERKTARKFFASMDTDRDGFVTKADWRGSQELFASLDTDNDGILASAEVVDALAPKPVVDAVTAALDPQEAALFNSMTASFLAKSAKAKKSEDEDEDKEEAVASKKAKSKKSEDEVEDEPKEAKKKAKAKKSEDEDTFIEDKKAGKGKKKAAEDDESDEPEDEEDDEGADKQACDMAEDAGMFGATGDPMGLGDGEADVLGEDDAMLAEIFGKSAADGDDDEDDKGDEPEASKKAGKKSEDEDEDDEGDEPEETKKATRLASTRTASQRPQPRKPQVGVRTVGGLTRTASGNAEINALSDMWESSPDVSKVFNG